LSSRCEAHTFEYVKKDATITVRVPRRTRRRLEALARRQGRSLSQQVALLIEGGLEREEGAAAVTAGGRAPLSGLLAGEAGAEHGDFQEVRTLLSASLLRAEHGRGPAGL
jgi:predicted transcriptional regulator